MQRRYGHVGSVDESTAVAGIRSFWTAAGISLLVTATVLATFSAAVCIYALVFIVDPNHGGGDKHQWNSINQLAAEVILLQNQTVCANCTNGTLYADNVVINGTLLMPNTTGGGSSKRALRAVTEVATATFYNVSQTVLTLWSMVQALVQDVLQLAIDVAALDVEVVALAVELAAFEASIGNLTLNLTTVEAEIAVLTANLTVVEAEVAVLTANLTTVEAEVAVLTANLTVVEAEVAVLTANLTTVEAEVAVLTANLTTVEAEVAVLTANLTTAEAEIAALNATVQANIYSSIRRTDDTLQTLVASYPATDTIVFPVLGAYGYTDDPSGLFDTSNSSYVRITRTAVLQIAVQVYFSANTSGSEMACVVLPFYNSSASVVPGIAAGSNHVSAGSIGLGDNLGLGAGVFSGSVNMFGNVVASAGYQITVKCGATAGDPKFILNGTHIGIMGK